jgi:hypothetical protein
MPIVAELSPQHVQFPRFVAKKHQTYRKNKRYLLSKSDAKTDGTLQIKAKTSNLNAKPQIDL